MILCNKSVCGLEFPCLLSSWIIFKANWPNVLSLLCSVLQASKGAPVEATAIVHLPAALKRAAKNTSKVVCTFFNNNHIFQVSLCFQSEKSCQHDLTHLPVCLFNALFLLIGLWTAWYICSSMLNTVWVFVLLCSRRVTKRLRFSMMWWKSQWRTRLSLIYLTQSGLPFTMMP